MVRRFRFRLYCFVLMDNHYHLLMELGESNLSRAVQWLNVSYSVWFNRRHRRRGHLFQGRFKSVTVSREEWGAGLEPLRAFESGEDANVRAGETRSASPTDGLIARAQGGTATGAHEKVAGLPVEFLSMVHRLGSGASVVGMRYSAGVGGGAKTEQRRRYRDCVETAAREELEQSPWEAIQEQVVLGGAEFLASLRKQIRGDSQEQRGARRLIEVRPGLEDVIAAVERGKGEKWDEFRDRQGDRGRDLVLQLGRRLCGLKLKELAAAVRLPNYRVVATNSKRYEQRLQSDRTELSQMKAVAQLLNCETPTALVWRACKDGDGSP